MASEMLPILANSEVFDQFSKQKSKLNFRHKTDGEFILFLLDTTTSMLSVVKQISPVIRAVEEVALSCENNSTEGSESDDAFKVIVKSEVTNREGREKLLLSIDPQAAEKELKATADDINNSKCQTILSEFSEEMTNLIENLSNPADDNSSHITTDKNEATLKISLMSKHSAGGYTHTEDNVSGRSPELTDSLLSDEKGANNQASCGVCGKKVGKGYLKEHLRLHLQDKWQCDYCHKTFSLRNYLVKHMKRFHGDKRFQCNLCQRSFASTVDLEKHMPIHKVSNPFICEVCQKGFAHYSSLKRHLIAHSGVKNYHCNKCDKYFMRKDSLNNHKVLSCSGKLDSSQAGSSQDSHNHMSHLELNDLLNSLNSNNVNLEGLGSEILEAISKAVR